MSFHVGQRVVCIDAGSIVQSHIYTTEDHPKGLVKGQVYTVRWVGDFEYLCGRHFSVRLEEYIRDSWDNPVGAARFRPVRETSIECFRAYLAPIKQRERA